MRQGIIIKEKPKWVPGVTSAPLTEKNYPQEPELVSVKERFSIRKRSRMLHWWRENFEAMFDNYTDIVGLTPLVGDRNSDFAVLQGHGQRR